MHKLKAYRCSICGAEVSKLPMPVLKHQMSHVKRRPFAGVREKLEEKLDPHAPADVVRLRRRFQLVNQILAERPQHVRADIAALDDLAVRCDGADQVRDREATFLEPLADQNGQPRQDPAAKISSRSSRA
jgi:hypothetical protein